jgi:hypothetical protein
MSCGKSRELADACPSAEASKTSGDSLKKEVMVMLKVKDVVLVPVKIVQIVEDETGVTYVVVPVKGNAYNSMKITKDDIKSFVEKRGG